VAGRLSWGFADQAVSSLTNFAIGIVVARSLGLEAFGIFSLAWVTYAVILNLSRGLATDPLMVRFSGVPSMSWRAAVRRSSGTALFIGIVLGGLSILAGLLLHGALGPALIALGIVLPALLVQDSWRYAFFAAGQGRQAFVNDIVWAVGLAPAFLLVHGHDSVSAFVMAWGVAGGIAAAFGCMQARVIPRPSRTWQWLKQQRDLGPRYMIENLCVSSSGQVRMYGLGAIAGLAAVGAVRGAVLLLGPFLAVLMGLALVAVPEAVRMLHRSSRRLFLFCLLLGVGQAAAALCWGLVLLFVLPAAGGLFILGDVWGPASALILPVTLEVMGAGLSTGAAAGLRALGAARRSLRAQLFTSVTYMTGGLAGAVQAGALGSAWGAAIAVLVSTSVWWSQLRLGLRDHASPLPPAPRDEQTVPPPEMRIR
jgi:O-antigen/teichoic acid export membrane protein